MDIRKLKTILDLFESSSLAEIEFCEGEERIKLSKHPSAPPPPAAAAPTSPPPAPAAAAPAPAAAEPAAAAEKEAPEKGTVIKAPMVGTFYRSPSPDKPPFASVGDAVKKGDTLCIVEAMKLMNEIPSPVAGVIRDILADDGEPVGFGAKLFVIEE